MLRCNVAGLIALMASDRYRDQVGSFYERYRNEFEGILRHKGYYLIRKLPKPVARQLLLPALPDLRSKQRKDGLWNQSERTTYDILSAIQYTQMTGVDDGSNGRLAQMLDNNESFYALLIKRDILGILGDTDRAAIAGLIEKEKEGQAADGSWENTIVGTVSHIEALLDLNLSLSDQEIWHGVEFLFANWNECLPGIHTKDAYGLIGHSIFTTADRKAEFDAAERLRPEWIPRYTCFRTLAIMQNSVCLSLLIRLGLENDDRVSRALDNLYNLYFTYGGVCAQAISKSPLYKCRIKVWIHIAKKPEPQSVPVCSCLQRIIPPWKTQRYVRSSPV